VGFASRSFVAIAFTSGLWAFAPSGCNSSGGSGSSPADAGSCTPLDATLASTLPEAGSSCAACIGQQCRAQVDTCSADCACNDTALTAFACVDGLAGNATLAAAASCIAPLVNSSNGNLSALGMCLQAESQTACVTECGAAPTDGGPVDGGCVDASLTPLLDAGSSPCEACLMTGTCAGALPACAGDCVCNAAAVTTLECLASLGADGSTVAATNCAVPLTDAINTNGAARTVALCLLTCSTACGLPMDGGPAAEASSSGGGSSSSGGSSSGGSYTPDGSGSATALPTAVAVDPSGNVFVATSNAIFAYSPIGAAPGLALVQTVAAAAIGSIDAGVSLVSPNGAQGLAVDGSGHLLVANYYESVGALVGCYFQSTTGSYGSDVVSYVDVGGATPLSSPTVLVDTTGSEIDAGTPIDCASGVAVATSGARMGTVFVATMGRIRVFGAAGEITTAATAYPAFANPHGIAYDSTNDYVYVTDGNNDAVYQYHFTGTALTLTLTISQFGDSGRAEPLNVAVDPSGNVYVSDLLSAGKVWVFSSTGAAQAPVLAEAPDGGACTASLAFDSAGRLYAACEAGGVYVYGPGAPWSMVGQIPPM
jgi:DNA-binding beta-propeller fold protein YncE